MAPAKLYFEVLDEVELRDSHGLRLHNLKKAQDIARENKEIIIKKWNEHLNR